MRFILLTAAALASATPLAAQARHLVHIRGDTKADTYGYAPSTISAHPGDVVVFRVEGGGKHSVSFEKSIPQAAASALNSAMPNRVGDLAGPLLGDGQEYVIRLPAAMPAGRYRFFCLPHRAYDEVGWLEVK